MNYRSKDAAKILALPAAQHPRLAKVAQVLANHPKVTVEDASELLLAAAKDAGLNELDIELGSPRNSVTVPFATTAKAPDKQAAFDANVNLHLTRIYRAKR